MIVRAHLFMLIQDNRLLERSRSFLMGRGYDMFDFRDPKKLLEAVMSRPQATVFLSASYTPAELEFLARTLTDLYRCTVVYFSEEDSVQGSAKLYGVKSGHKLFGRLSGPAIERTLRQINRPAPHPAVQHLNAQKTPAPRALRAKIEAKVVLDQIQNRLRHFMDSKPDAWMKRTENVRRVECYKFYFEKSSQVFLIASGHETSASEAMSRRVCDAIKEVLLEQGLQVLDESRFTVTTEPFDFTQWALESKSPFFTTADRGNEWSIALCDTAEQFGTERDGGDQEMFRLPIDNLVSGETVDFDLYVYFPASRKMVLLVPRGASLTPGTFAALKKNLIAHLNVYKDDRHRMRRYVFEKELRHRLLAGAAQNSA